MRHLKLQRVPIVTKVVFSRKAQQQLIEHALFIFDQSKNPDIADAYLDKMRAFIIDILSRFPRSGRPSDDIEPNTRKLVYQGFSIIYRITDEQIEILTLYKENRL